MVLSLHAFYGFKPAKHVKSAKDGFEREDREANAETTKTDLKFYK